MKLIVRVKGKPAMIVGYAPGRKAPLAIIICDGKLTHCKLTAVELLNVPKTLRKPKATAPQVVAA